MVAFDGKEYYEIGNQVTSTKKLRDCGPTCLKYYPEGTVFTVEKSHFSHHYSVVIATRDGRGLGNHEWQDATTEWFDLVKSPKRKGMR